MFLIGFEKVLQFIDWIIFRFRLQNFLGFSEFFRFFSVFSVFSVCFETVCFGCFASLPKQRVSMFRLTSASKSRLLPQPSAQFWRYSIKRILPTPASTKQDATGRSWRRPCHMDLRQEDQQGDGWLQQHLLQHCEGFCYGVLQFSWRRNITKSLISKESTTELHCGLSNAHKM